MDDFLKSYLASDRSQSTKDFRNTYEEGQNNKKLYEQGEATRVITGYTTREVGPDGSTKVPTYAYIPNQPVASSTTGSTTRPDQRSTGEYDDIINSLRIDQNAATARSEQLRQQQADQYQADFSAMSTTFQQQIDQLNSANAANLQSLNRQYDQQTQAFNAFQDLAASQLATAEANYQNQLRMTENLYTAFVPEPNPSAFTASVGDQRTETSRKTQNNKLSDLSSLSIISGLGTASNPLSGLQLA